MPRPDDTVRALAQQWLIRARSNLARAQQPKPVDVLWEDLCFDAQQAAEKALKAVLVYRQVDFPKTHDVQALLSLVERSGSALPEPLWDAERLTTYATVMRYPGAGEVADENRYREALALAVQVVRWANEAMRV